MDNLSKREKQIFNMLIAGIHPNDIADKLGICYATVDTHRSKLYKKLGVKGYQELVANYSAVDNNNTSKFISLATDEEPLPITFFKNDPYGWTFTTPLPIFFDKKIKKGDIYHFSCFFVSNVDFDIFLVCLIDNKTGKDGYTFLSHPNKILANVKKNVKNNCSMILIPDKTASSLDPLANRLSIDIQPFASEPPSLTFTKFSLEKR